VTGKTGNPQPGPGSPPDVPKVRWTHRHRRALKISTVVLVAHLLGLATSMHALMSARTAPGATAWIVALNAMPYVAVPAYWVFGRSKFKDYISLRREAAASLKETLEQELAGLEPFRTRWSADARQTFRAVEKLARLHFVDGNRVALLINGEQTFASIFDGIAAANDYLLVQFYIVRDDEQGRQLQRRLIERAREGVRVHLLLDEIGSGQLSQSYIDELTDSGVGVRWFRSNRGWTNKFQLNFRNHRKIVVADGKRGWVGGLNVGNEYQAEDWRDTHLLVEGPAVLHMQVSFQEDWHWAADDLLELSWSPHSPGGQGVPVLVVPSGPADGVETASLMIQQFVNLAEQRVWISTPYLVPDSGVVASLQLAALRGVDVRLLIPEQSDSLVVSLAAYPFIDPLLEVGIRIYRYQPGLMHGKTFLFDDNIAAVSTANLDNRSLRINFESTVLVAASEFVTEVEAMFQRDFAASHEIETEEFAGKPLWFRISARAAYLFAPIL
jgi:cardiolipin synthase A/B